jgi:endonuclease/exonuclease/phosphatase family metal-dependent hydrolase
MLLKVLSWNIWVECHFEELTKYLTNADADIVALQEVKAADPERDVLKFLASRGYQSAVALKQYWEAKDFFFGPAIFSKFPIESSEVFVLSEEHKRFAVRADIRTGEELLHVFSVHLKHDHQQNTDIQYLQAQTLLDYAPAEHSIVAGDFNATPESRVVQLMQGKFANTDPSNASTWSMYPEGCDECSPQHVDTRLDYIFASADLKTSDPQVHQSPASDHLPISVMVSL